MSDEKEVTMSDVEQAKKKAQRKCRYCRIGYLPSRNSLGIWMHKTDSGHYAGMCKAPKESDIIEGATFKNVEDTETQECKYCDGDCNEGYGPSCVERSRDE